MNATLSMDELTGRIEALAGASTADLIDIAPGDAFSAEEAREFGAQFGRFGRSSSSRSALISAARRRLSGSCAKWLLSIREGD